VYQRLLVAVLPGDVACSLDRGLRRGSMYPRLFLTFCSLTLWAWTGLTLACCDDIRHASRCAARRSFPLALLSLSSCFSPDFAARRQKTTFTGFRFCARAGCGSCASAAPASYVPCAQHLHLRRRKEVRLLAQQRVYPSPRCSAAVRLRVGTGWRAASAPCSIRNLLAL